MSSGYSNAEKSNYPIANELKSVLRILSNRCCKGATSLYGANIKHQCIFRPSFAFEYVDQKNVLFLIREKLESAKWEWVQWHVMGYSSEKALP